MSARPASVVTSNSTTTPAQSEWQPGDPLHEPGSYRSYFFNFRPLADESERCSCHDSASWPTPFQKDDLDVQERQAQLRRELEDRRRRSAENLRGRSFSDFGVLDDGSSHGREPENAVHRR